MTTRMQELAERVVAGDRRALARAITVAEDQDPRWEDLLRRVFPRSGRATTVGVTGPPGVGKSTLIDGLISAQRRRGRSVAVISVDPSSPFSSGAILGDRLRMSRHFQDPGVFIRSMGTRGAVGGLARGTGYAVSLADAAGLDVVIVETVGVGQVEVDVASRTDSVVLVLMPGAGDSVQALKSGIMEIPDIIVINRTDDPRAKSTLRHVREALLLRAEGAWKPPIVQTQASTGEGVEALQDALESHRTHLSTGDGLLRRRRLVAQAQIRDIVTAHVAAQVDSAMRNEGRRMESLLDDVAARKIDPVTAAQEIASCAVAR